MARTEWRAWSYGPCRRSRSRRGRSGTGRTLTGTGAGAGADRARPGACGAGTARRPTGRARGAHVGRRICRWVVALGCNRAGHWTRSRSRDDRLPRTRLGGRRLARREPLGNPTQRVDYRACPYYREEGTCASARGPGRSRPTHALAAAEVRQHLHSRCQHKHSRYHRCRHATAIHTPQRADRCCVPRNTGSVELRRLRPNRIRDLHCVVRCRRTLAPEVLRSRRGEGRARLRRTCRPRLR
jgi:hypothetical protein